MPTNCLQSSQLSCASSADEAEDTLVETIRADTRVNTQAHDLDAIASERAPLTRRPFPKQRLLFIVHLVPWVVLSTTLSSCVTMACNESSRLDSRFCR